MGEFEFVQVTQEALWLVLILSGPPIAVAAIVGLLVAFLQSVTQLQEQTLSFAVKFVAIVITLFLTAGLLGSTLYHFGNRIFTRFAVMVGG